MKRKIIFSFFLLFLVSASGAVFSIVYINNITHSLERLINLHQIEDFRQNLVMSIQTVQSNLYTVRTHLGQTIDTITDNVTKLETSAKSCSDCHHEESVAAQIANLQNMVESYEQELSHYITASANKQNIERLKSEAAAVGNNLLSLTEDMSVQASKHLEEMTSAAMKKIHRVQTLLTISLCIAFILGSYIAISLIFFITRPIEKLVDATRQIAQGNLGHTIDYHDRTEFGEFVMQFNEMSVALKESYASLTKEISDRKQAQFNLGRSEAFLNTIFDSIQDPFCIIDREFKFVRLNDAYSHLKGKPQEELLGKVCYSVLNECSDVCDKCVIDNTFKTGQSGFKEKMITTPAGENIWIAIYTYPILDSGGTITHVIEYSRDITKRKQTEEALKASEERYALSAKGANDGLWDWNLKTNSLYYSPRWKSMLGYKDDEVQNSPEEWTSRMHADDKEQFEVHLNAHLNNTAENLECEYRIRHKDGTYRWMLCRGIAIRDEKGAAYRMAGSQTDITARKVAEEQLIYDAFHDSLTGLPNRALLMERLDHVIKSSKRTTENMYAVMFIDVDRFKVINDSLGHLVGDKLLVELAKRYQTCLRPGDTVARLGGDEFAIILENIFAPADAQFIAERIQREIQPPFNIDGQEIYISQSIGITVKTPEYERPEQVLRDADIAMYQAKSKGKSRFEFFETKMHSSVTERLQLEADLRHSVEHTDDFVIHYQPIIDLKTHKLRGFEALIRWKHPRRGIIPPMDFIPLAEETGMINVIGDLVMKTVIKQLKEWQIKFRPASGESLKMSFNVSAKQFLEKDFSKKLLNFIHETNISPSDIAIEITESIIMDNTDVVAKNIQELQRLGVHIHIDDFGTGYSSLSYLHHLPVHALKIDRLFIEKMAQSDENLEIVKTIILLARNLDIEVIAEGIEETAQLNHVMDLACHYAQGFLISKPMLPEHLEKILQKEKLI